MCAPPFVTKQRPPIWKILDPPLMKEIGPGAWHPWHPPWIRQANEPEKEKQCPGFPGGRGAPTYYLAKILPKIA